MPGKAKLRQAVVVIHGIGEQKPMTTLRQFTTGALSSDAPAPRFTSHPDRYSQSLELFTLRAPPRSAGNVVPITDFYECHWAHRMRDTTFSQVWVWIARLIFTRPRKNSRSDTVYRIALLSVIAVIGLVFAILLRYPAVSDWVDAASVLGGGIATAALVGVLRYYIGGYVGDAARYLTPNPDNLAERAAIRQQAILLLKRLHRKKRYQRIVVVGHSLGSVIAYDVVSHLWDHYRQDQRENVEQQVSLIEIEILGRRLRDAGKALQAAEADLGKAPKSARGDRKKTAETCRNAVEQIRGDFRKMQTQLWLEQKRIGNPWLITDLITLGSPLAHADYLLRAAGDREWGLKERENSGEFPRCPPLADNWYREAEQRAPADKESAIAYRPLDERTRTIVPSGLFAFVRWTNLYFPGDLIAGPLVPEFGYGIKDVPVRRFGTKSLKDFLASWSPSSHTKYWDTSDPEANTPLAATEELRKSLALETEDIETLLRETAGIQRFQPLVK